MTAAVLAAAAVAFVPSESAQAAPPGAGIDNTDPSSTGCSASAITYWSKNLTNPATGVVNGTMELRYSRSCETNWVRINNYVSGATAQKTIVRLHTYAPSGGSVPYAQDITSDTVTGWSYGMQLYAPSWVCVQVGGVITLNGQVIASNGQSLDWVC
ncbi:DUF2690 domain-containing protein [Dactylosporangium siamense]|nr:DUF2690 domain-containing protein [Dactylosporangium siamense]